MKTTSKRWLNEIPPPLIPQCNDIIEQARNLATFNDNDVDEETLPALRALSKNIEIWKDTLTAHTRVAGRFGLKKKLINTVEVGLLLLKEMIKLQETLQSIYDVIRVQVSFPVLSLCLPIIRMLT